VIFTPSVSLASLNGVRKFLVIFKNKNNKQKKNVIISYTTIIYILYSCVGDWEKTNSYTMPLVYSIYAQGKTWDQLISGYLLLKKFKYYPLVVLIMLSKYNILLIFNRTIQVQEIFIYFAFQISRTSTLLQINVPCNRIGV